MENKDNFYLRLLKYQLEFKDMVKEGMLKTEKKQYSYLTLKSMFNKMKSKALDYGILIIAGDTSECREVETTSNYTYCVNFKKEFMFFDTVTSEHKFTLHSWAYGTNDSYDKAKGTANTYAFKYFLRDLFQISDEELDSDNPNNPQNKVIKPKKIMKDANGKVIWEPSDSQLKWFKVILSKNKILKEQFKIEMESAGFTTEEYTKYICSKGAEWFSEWLGKNGKY